MTADALWQAFAAACPDAPATHEAWAFGAEPDALARLVLAGRKTATASAYPLYALHGEPLPRAGACDVLLDGWGRRCACCAPPGVCGPLSEVTAEHAFQEGEGDRTLASWRAVHEAFFTGEMERAGLTFTEEMPVVCEEFEVAYRP